MHYVKGFYDLSAAADFLGPGAIEINRYQSEILDMIRRRFPLGQRIDQTPATGQPSRYFEQLGIPTANFVPPRQLTSTSGQPTRVERTIPLKAITAGINFSIFDVEVNAQQGQFPYLESKDLTDTVDGVLKVHDQALWNGNDTSLTLPSTAQYFGISGQIITAPQSPTVPNQSTIPLTGSLVDYTKRQAARMASNTSFEVRPSAIYGSPLGLDLFDREAKAFQLYYNKVQILPGVIVAGIPTQVGVLPLVPDPAITVFAPAGGVAGDPLSTYTMFVLSEDLVQYHWLTNPLPRVFQLGLQNNLASQYTVVKFGAVVVKGASYAHAALFFTR
jgi:hypothetical protein